MYRHVLRPLLFCLSAETAHGVSIFAMRQLQRLNLLKHLLPSGDTSTETIEIMGLPFPNRIGLAAGLDKNGDAIDAFGAYGFGFIEIGTVTPRAQAGNPKPRLFRLPKALAIINRMGFNNHGIDALIHNVTQASYQGILGINIGKNADTPIEHATEDYLIGLRKAYDFADYIAVNISSPNTKNLRNLQSGDAFHQLLAALKNEQLLLSKQHQRYVPIAIKVAPDLDEQNISEIAAALLHYRLDAVIATNTTLARDTVFGLPHANETGGLSGAPLRDKSTAVIKLLRKHLQGRLPIIGVGGVNSGTDAQEKLAAGADLVQIYSGLIYQGPALVKECVQATR